MGRGLAVAGGVVAGILVLVGAVVVGGEPAQVVLAGLEVAPLLVLALLLQAGLKRGWLRLLAYLWLGLLVIGFGFLVLGLAGASLARGAHGDWLRLLVGVAEAGLVVLGSLVIAGLCCLRGARDRIAAYLPIDPASPVHAVALFLTVYITLSGFGQLAVLGGEPPLLSAIADVPAEVLTRGRSTTGQVLDLFYGLAWMLPLAVVAAGYPLRRSLRAAVVRLGFTRPSRNQVLLGLALAVALAGVFAGIDQVVGAVWRALGWPTTNQAAFQKLLGATYSLPGALAIGVTAGIGEEATTRGLLQPRLGKVLPNLAFVAGHAFQYGPDALLSVFLLGMVLAFVRARSSTAIAALVHGTYDCLVVLAGVLGF